MGNISFYPMLTEELAEKAGCSTEKYEFSYLSRSWECELKQSGRSVIKLTDPLEMWKIEDDGLRINKHISIAYPEFLYGKEGIVCTKAELGICIIWTNKALTQTGIIMPIYDVANSSGRTCDFEFDFDPGRITGDLELSLIMYVRKKADTIDEDEQSLMNEEGVTVGVLETVILDFNSAYMEFPIEEYDSPTEPLWWVEFSQWEDPKTIETFTKDNICLYLNPHYPTCPMTDGTIKNPDMLIEILSMTYFLIFNRLSTDDLRATRFDTGLEPGSICSVLHQFIEDCVDLRFDSDERLLKSLQTNIRRILTEGD